MHSLKWLLIVFILLSIVVTACQTQQEYATVTLMATVEATSMPVPVIETATLVPSATQTTGPEPEPTVTPTYVDYETIACYSDELPYAWAESAAALGWKFFAERESIPYRMLYFPAMCAADRIEADMEYLLYQNTKVDETIFIFLEETYSGTLGQFYTHLTKYDFWAMGPEDYPMILNREENVNPNLIFFRVDRMNGEGWEGNEILGIMVGMGEHEYIHTVQATNHPGIAFDIWTDPIYQATVEFYANLNNNSGQRYYRAPSAYLSLIQMLDGLLQMGELEEDVAEILSEENIDLEEFLNRELLIYDSNIQDLMINMAGNNYLEHLTREELNALMLATWVGLGDPLTYQLVRSLYDRNVAEYNLWYYGSDTTNHLPETFDELFRPYD
jgi:hypothetical protein